MKLIFPNSQRINRGNYETSQLMDACRSNDVTDIIIVHEHRGVPGGARWSSCDGGLVGLGLGCVWVGGCLCLCVCVDVCVCLCVCVCVCVCLSICL